MDTLLKVSIPLILNHHPPSPEMITTKLFTVFHILFIYKHKCVDIFLKKKNQQELILSPVLHFAFLKSLIQYLGQLSISTHGELYNGCIKKIAA